MEETNGTRERKTVRISMKKDAAGKHAKKTEAKKRETRVCTIVGAIILLSLVCVLAAFVSDYVVGSMNARILERSEERRAEESGPAAGESPEPDKPRTEFEAAAAEAELKRVTTSFGNVHIPPAETPAAAASDSTQSDGSASSSSPPAESTGVDAGKKTITSSLEGTDNTESSPAAAAAGQCNADGVTGCPDSKRPITMQEEEPMPARDANTAAEEGSEAAKPWNGVDPDQTAADKPSNLDDLMKGVPPGHRSLEGADAAKCPFSHGMKPAPRKFLVKPDSEAFRASKVDTDLRDVQPHVGERSDVAALIPAVPLKSGHQMPVFGLGTFSLGSREGLAIVKTALNLGYRHFDTSQLKSSHQQEIIGIALMESDVDRSEVFITTKVDSGKLTRDDVFKATNGSLRLLGVDYLDLLVLNEPICDSKCQKKLSSGAVSNLWLEAWRTMEELHRDGVVRDLGVGMFNLSQLGELVATAKSPVSVVQSHFDPIRPDKEIRAYCKSHDIIYQGLNVLGSAWQIDDEMLAENPVLSNDVVQRVAEKHMSTPAQIVLAWALDHDVAVVPSTTNVSHLMENMAAIALSLDEEEAAAVSSLNGYMDQQRAIAESDEMAERDRDVLTDVYLSLEELKEELRASRHGELGSAAVTTELPPDSPVLLVPVSSAKAGSGGTLAALNPVTGEEYWSFRLNGGLYAAPTVSADRSVVYLGTGDRHVYALSLRNAERRWEFGGNHSFAAPILQDGDEGHVYALDMGGNLHVLTRQTGDRTRFQKYSDVGFLGSGIHTATRTLLLTTLESEWANFVAVDYVGGAMKYELELRGSATTSPIVSHDGSLVFAAGAGLVYGHGSVCAISVKKQKKVWSKSMGAMDEFAPTLALSADDRTLFAVHPTGLFQSFSAAKGSLQAEVYIGEGPVHAAPVQLNSTSVLVASGDGWLYTVCLRRQRFFAFKNLRSSVLRTPVLRGDTLFVATSNGRLHCIDLPSGRFLWQKTYKESTFNAPLSLH